VREAEPSRGVGRAVGLVGAAPDVEARLQEVAAADQGEVVDDLDGGRESGVRAATVRADRGEARDVDAWEDVGRDVGDSELRGEVHALRGDTGRALDTVVAQSQLVDRACSEGADVAQHTVLL